MSVDTRSGPQPVPGTGIRAGIVGMAVGLFTVIASTVITFILPESYLSLARIQVSQATGNDAGQPPPGDAHFPAAEWAALQSDAVLDRVVERLNLGERWGRRLAAGGKLQRDDCLRRLRSRMELRPSRGVPLIEVRVSSEDRNEAAEMANAVVESYRSLRTDVRVEIVDRAEPSLRPFRPNVPLNLWLGACGGILLGGLAGSLTFLIATRLRAPPPAPGPPQPPPCQIV